MAIINEFKQRNLSSLGYTGSLNDMWLSFLRTMTGKTTGNVNDLEKFYLGGSNSILDRWKAFLVLNGVTRKDLNDAMKVFWSSIGAGALTVKNLFASNEVGVWYDPSDFSTLFQDSAGTTPVTAVGQTVGKILDKSSNGNHATQATSTARPILGRHPITGRRNLLRSTHAFGTSPWVANLSPTVTQGFTSPDGEATATRMVTTAAITSGYYQTSDISFPVGSIALHVKLKDNGGAGKTVRIGVGQVLFGGTGGDRYVHFNLTTGTFTSVNAVFGTPTASLDSSGFWHVKLLFTSTASGSGTAFVYAAEAAIVDVIVAHPQFEASATPTAYQKVVSTYDVTEAGVNDAYYLKFDGVDDFMITPSIDFSGTDKVSVFAGVRKLSDAAQAMVAELTVNSATEVTAAFSLQAPGPSVSYRFVTIANTNGITADATGLAAPRTSVLSGIGNLNTKTSVLRDNGTIVASSTNLAAPDNNLANAPIYIGMRAGTSLPFNGHLYSLVVRGALSDANQIAATENYINNKTGAY